MTQNLDDQTRDTFWEGKIRLWQPRKGYRAGVDSVFLAAAIPAGPGQTALELGCGAGAAALCLAARVPGISVTGVENQPSYVDLARRNAVENNLPFVCVQSDIADLPADVRQCQFDHVMANPPYFEPQKSLMAADPGRGAARASGTPLSTWINVAARRLAPKGYFHMIQRVERLPDLLTACQNTLGSVEILPLSPRSGRQARLVILRARKDGRAAFVLHPPVILHVGDRHLKDADSYMPKISAVLRDGAALPWPNRAC